MLYTERITCRSCDAELPKENILDLGLQTIVDFLEDGEAGRGEAPLELVACVKCTLLQLRHTVDQDTLYRRFFYRSGINQQMVEALASVAAAVRKYAKVQQGDLIGDIGSNDGELLTNYGDKFKLVGFEPATALAEDSQKRLPSATIVADYFSAENALKASDGKKYRAISAVACFYDLEEPGKFLKEVVEVLDDTGVFVIQMNYLMTMIRNLAFDNVSHEHLSYYSLASLKLLLERHGLKIIHVELNSVNGGSIRVITTKNKSRKSNFSVLEQLRIEKASRIEDSYQHFGERVKNTVKQLRDFLLASKRAKKVVYAYGASTRGLVILQKVFEGLKYKNLIAGVAERDINKIGKRMAGVDLPIVDEQEAREKADYFLLLPYHFWPSISQREKSWMLMGGKFVIPVPFPKVISLSELKGSQEFLLVAQELEEEFQAVGAHS